MFPIAAPPYGGGGPWCLLWVALLVGGIIAAIVWWRRGRSGGGRPGGPPFGRGPTGESHPSGHRSAEDILAERYARGDITDEEYMQRQSVLREGR